MPLADTLGRGRPMRYDTMVALLTGLLASACVAAPVSIGSPSLAAKPNPHLEPDPALLIGDQLHRSIVYAECSAPAGPDGPASNLDTSLIPSNEYVQRGRRAQALTEPYRFTIRLSDGALKGSIVQVTVPAGFVSDFHSTPDSAVQMTLPVRRALEAAVVHDWLYAVGNFGDTVQRQIADQAYSDILHHYGVGGFTHWAVSSGVRLGGKKSFGDPAELRFYNKCYYGQCEYPDVQTDPELASRPVLALRPDPALRTALWNLTVCIRDRAPDSTVAALTP